MQLSTNMTTDKKKEEENPYGAYFLEYAEVRKGLKASEENVDDTLIAAMGAPSHTVPESLQSLHDFVHRAIEERKIPLNWVFQAECDVEQAERIQKRIARLGEALSAKVTINTEGGRGLGKTRAQQLCRGIGIMVASEVLAGLGPAAIDLREHHISSITADVREGPQGVYAVVFAVEGRHPQLDLPLEAHGTAQMQIM